MKVINNIEVTLYIFIHIKTSYLNHRENFLRLYL